MQSKASFLWMLCIVVAALATALALRDANNHMFYSLRKTQAEAKRLKQQLWQKQLRLESVTHPGRVIERMDPNEIQ